jgi:hypothetical protein
MTAITPPASDWTYRDAWGRVIRAGRRALPRHTATGRLDERGNRVVACSCGWTGNALGWGEHLDSVVRSALGG